MDKDTLDNYEKGKKVRKEKESTLTARQKKYLRKYAHKIDFLCCKHGNKQSIKYHIGYIGLKCCKIAVCVDCDTRQILCTGFCKWLLFRFLKKGIKKINILETIAMEDSFMYRR
jgi:hypothetical protein